MTAHGLFSTAERASMPLAIAVLLVCRGWSAEPGQNASSSDSATPSLVREALEKEVAGDNRQRESLLRQALDQSPKDPAARWQLGQVRLHDKWQSPADIELASRYDKRLAEYSKRRDAAGLNVADQVALARWCRKNQLDQQQRVHWALVLQLQPDNADALKALGLRPYHGTLATPSQIDQLRAQMHRVAQATDRWRPRIGQWLGAIQRSNALLPQDLRDRICAISDSCEMLGLERALWLEAGAKNKKQELHRMVLAIALALADNPYPAGAEALVRGATFSDFKDVRSAAISELKKHPLDHYVPLLLSGLQSLIEADMQCMLSATGDLITRYSVFQEGALNNVSASLLLAPVDNPGGLLTTASVMPGTGTVKFDNPREEQLMIRNFPKGVAAAMAEARTDRALLPGELANANAANAAVLELNRQVNAARSQAQARQQEATFRDAVDRTNLAIAQRNAQIMTVLCQTTDQQLDDQPAKWWAWWWQDYNESYNVTGGTSETDHDSPAKPETHYDSYVEYQGSAPTYGTMGSVGTGRVPCSCFALGTKVWTFTGRQAIEKVKVGDCVLAQDVESGELAYKPVLAITIRQPGPRMRVSIGRESIIATPSHPFWVVGQGWRMTKQLAVGDRVHTPSGGVAVESIEKLQADPSFATGWAYNLIVADFNSYFVGDNGILVHDNTPRTATAARLPGLGPRPTQVAAP